MFPYHQDVRINELTLGVSNVDKSGRFYEKLLGLEAIKENDKVLLKSEEETLLILEETKEDSFQREGLFHIAFLLESRQALGEWFLYQKSRSVRIYGASDHIVSEAFYFEDPDGHGVEVYSDRPKEEWIIKDSQVQMDTKALDIASLVKGLKTPNKLSSRVKVGHMHLQVKDQKPMEEFYKKLGLQTMFDMGSAVFMAYSQYHHHIAFNTWKRGILKDYQVGHNIVSFKLHLTPSLASQIPEELRENPNQDDLVLTDPIGIRIHLHIE